MLNDIRAGIQQFHAHRANIGKLGLLGEMGQPARLLYNNVIVHEQQHLAVGILRAEVIESGHIKAHSLEDIQAPSLFIDL